MAAEGWDVVIPATDDKNADSSPPTSWRPAMAAGDELLAEIRNLVPAYREAADGSSYDDEHTAARELADSIEALDEYMKAGGPPPAEWTPATPGWDVIIAFQLDSDHANRACANIQDRYGWTCAVRQRGTQQEVVIPFPIRQNAESRSASSGTNSATPPPCGRPGTRQANRRSTPS